MILDTGVLISVDREEERARVFLTAAARTSEPLHTSEGSWPRCGVTGHARHVWRRYSRG